MSLGVCIVQRKFPSSQWCRDLPQTTSSVATQFHFCLPGTSYSILISVGSLQRFTFQRYMFPVMFVAHWTQRSSHEQRLYIFSLPLSCRLEHFFTYLLRFEHHFEVITLATCAVQWFFVFFYLCSSWDITHSLWLWLSACSTIYSQEGICRFEKWILIHYYSSLESLLLGIWLFRHNFWPALNLLQDVF